MSTTQRAAALICTAGLLAVSSLAYGQAPTLTQADFDRCNQQAQAALSKATPSASPTTSPSAATAPAPGRSPSTAAPSGSAVSGSGSVSSGASAPTGGISSRTDASSSSDPLLRGMASAGLNDPAYQLAYRNCLAGR
jgi:hypothetical protein